MLRCLNELCHINLDVFEAPWRKDNIFEIFESPTRKSRVDKIKCLYQQSQSLDGEDKDNQITQDLLVITTQEQKVLKKFLENNFEVKCSALELTK